jgi:NifB/MoaA-like Fe-S oxidoreductase
VVPVGLSKFRHNLYPIERIDASYAEDFLEKMDVTRTKLRDQLGTRFVFPSDEWFAYAGLPIPPRSWYEDFPQFEDGIGTFRLFMDEAAYGLKRLKGRRAKQTKMTLVTGVLPSRVISEFAGNLSQIDGIDASVLPIVNEFFGTGITVAGLVTFKDLLNAINCTDKSGMLVIPDIMLKDGTLFLDDSSVDDLREASGMDVRVAPSRAKQFLTDWLPKNVDLSAA